MPEMSPWKDVWKHPDVKIVMRGNVHLDDDARASAVQAILDRHQLNAAICPRPIPDGGGGTISTIALVASAPVAAFFSAMAAEAGKDAWNRLKLLAQDLERYGREVGYEKVRVEIRRGEEMIELPPGLPDHAYAPRC
jgi:hypothetical protein